ncbi:MAG: hypothetical protein Q8Q73_00450 [Stagnimonas sp.]|nr:hypothetical protein [Stagnimonas sp.]
MPSLDTLPVGGGPPLAFTPPWRFLALLLLLIAMDSFWRRLRDGESRPVKQ